MNCADISVPMQKPATRPEHLPSFGRRLGRKLTPHKQWLLDEFLPQLVLKAPEPGKLNTACIVPGAREIWLEIGFGGGEHLAALAKEYPDVAMIGAEPYLNGVVKLLGKIEREGIKNIRLVPDDVRPVMDALPDHSLQRIYLLFPDPWPKQRHYKRRIVTQAFLDNVARLLPQGGVLQLATDHYDYSVWMFEQLLQRMDFKWQADSFRDWHLPPQNWTQTRYEAKTGKQGRQPVYLKFIRQ